MNAKGDDQKVKSSSSSSGGDLSEEEGGARQAPQQKKKKTSPGQKAAKRSRTAKHKGGGLEKLVPPWVLDLDKQRLVDARLRRIIIPSACKDEKVKPFFNMQGYSSNKSKDRWDFLLLWSDYALQGRVCPSPLQEVMSLLSSAMRTLNTYEISMTDVKEGHKELIHALVRMEGLLPVSEARFVIHMLVHILEDIRRHGPTYSWAAWAPEAAQGTFKSLVVSTRYPIGSLVRQWQELEAVEQAVAFKLPFAGLTAEEFQKLYKSTEAATETTRRAAWYTSSVEGAGRNMDRQGPWSELYKPTKLAGRSTYRSFPSDDDLCELLWFLSRDYPFSWDSREPSASGSTYTHPLQGIGDVMSNAEKGPARRQAQTAHEIREFWTQPAGQAQPEEHCLAQSIPPPPLPRSQRR
jgi:hypothetical protein